MICYVCSINATHRIYGDLKPVCGKHLVEAVDEEGGDLMISTIEAEVNRTDNDARIEAIKVKIDILKAKKDVLNEVTLALIGSTNHMVSVFEVQAKYSTLQEELFTEWKRLSEENYQAFQKWFDGLGMGVSK